MLTWQISNSKKPFDMLYTSTLNYICFLAYPILSDYPNKSFTFQSISLVTHTHEGHVFYGFFDDTVENWEEQLQEWTNVIETYVQLDKLMNARSEFSDKMIENFQKLADKFFKSWVKLIYDKIK